MSRLDACLQLLVGGTFAELGGGLRSGNGRDCGGGVGMLWTGWCSPRVDLADGDGFNGRRFMEYARTYLFLLVVRRLSE